MSLFALILYLYGSSIRDEMPLITTEEKLNERIKELSCLYTISTTFLKGRSLDDTLQEICDIVRTAWRYPESAIVGISIDDYAKATADFPVQRICQQSAFIIADEVRGRIMVCYDATIHNEASFLEDEQRLLDKVASDITNFYEKQLKDKEITILKRSAERADRLVILGEITAGIAHELNTPLGNILGFAELIAARNTDSQTDQDVAKVIKAAIYSREIVKKLMFFSCEMPQHMQCIQIKPIVEQALALLDPNFRKAGITYELQIANPDIEAQLDPIQLTQVLFNILVNAIYVAPIGSMITTRLYNDAESVFLEMADQGPGIAAEHQQKIFEPFFTTKPFGEGNGLGLSVVHGIIKSHRGKISTFVNTPTGTVFKIQLPIRH